MAQNKPSVFGTLLRQHRMAAGLTQEELAERAQISVRTISDLERGIASRPHGHTARGLADALALSEDDRSRFLDARFMARESAVSVPSKAPAHRPALHVVSSPAGSGPDAGPPESGAAVRPTGGRDADLRSALRRAASLATRTDTVRPSVSSRKMFAITSLVVLAGALALLALRSFGTTAPPAVVLAGRLDPHWPLAGTTPGTLSNPSAVAVDAAGSVYVADTGNDRVDRFSSTGRFLGSFGSIGSGHAQFRGPKGIAVDGSGHVYVSDAGNDRIQKFSSGGTWLASWGSRGSRLGQLRLPQGLAIDSAGYLYVADRENNRIQEFSQSGTFLHAWGPGIPTGPDFHPPPNLHHPVAVALDQASNIYVADGGFMRLHEFSPFAVPLGDWGPTGSGPGRLVDPTAIAVKADGTVVVAQGSGTPLLEYGATTHDLLRRQLRSKGIYAAGIALGTDGTFLVTDSRTDRVLRLDSAGNVTARFGRPRVEPRELRAPGSLTVGPRGELYVADTGHRRIVQLDPDGRWVSQIGQGVLGFPRSVAVERRSGELYVLDSATDHVRRFSPTGKLLTTWGGFGDPRGIAVDTAGNVYVTDDTAGTIQKFTGGGARLASWTIAPPDITNGIGAIAIDRHGTIYVAVPNQGAMLRFSRSGQMLGQWSHFHGDIAVATDALDHVYAADAGRFEEFSPAGHVLRSVKLPASTSDGPSLTAGITVDAGFNAFVSDRASNRILRYLPGKAG